MPEISPIGLRQQLLHAVGAIAMAPDEQEKWLRAWQLPVDELALQLGAAVPSWFRRSRGHGLIQLEAEEALIVL